MTNYSPLTLSQVSAMVGGPQWDARYGSLHIIRTVGNHRTVTTLNIRGTWTEVTHVQQYLEAQAPDVIMLTETKVTEATTKTTA